MSGSLGTCPISPAAKPAKPAPSVTRSSRFGRGDELRARPRVHVHELREVELDAALLRLLADVLDGGRGGVSRAMRLLLDVRDERVDAQPRPGDPAVRCADGHAPSDRRAWSAARAARPARAPPASFTIFTAISTMSQSSLRRSRPESSPIRRRRWRSVFGWTYSASAVALMLPRRRRNSSSVAQERGRALAVVLGDARDRVAVRVADVAVERHAQEVLVRAELLVGHHAGRPLEDGRAEQRVARLLEARPRSSPRPGRRSESPIETGGSSSCLQSGGRPRRSCSSPSAGPGGARGSSRRGGRRASPAPRPPGARSSWSSAGRGGEDDVPLVEVAAQPGGAALESRERLAAGELLEEVLDQVLLGQALDQLDLLERDRGLVGDGASEVDLATCPSAARSPSSSSFATSGTATEAGAAAAGELGPELGEADRRRGRRRRPARRRARCSTSRAGVEQVDVARLGAREASARARRRPEARCRASPLGRGVSPELGEVLELVDAPAHLLVEARVLDRPGDERGARDEHVDLVLA